MNCESAQKELSLFLYGELSNEREALLEEHLDGCADCRRELDVVKAMHAALDQAELEPAPELLLECRRDLRAASLAMGRVPLRPVGFWQKLTFLFPSLAGAGRGWPQVLVKPVGALALVAIGFFGARLAQSPGGISPLDEAGVVGTRVRYVEPDPSGRVKIVVEETHRRTVTGSRGEDRIRNLLLAAAQDPTDPGLRVESVDLLKNECDTADVRSALLHVLEHDPNPGVRLKAMEGLKPFGGDPRVRRVIAHVLLRDENPGLRAQAIDVLVQNKQRDVVGALQELMLREENDYIRSRTQRLLHEMNASVETF